MSTDKTPLTSRVINVSLGVLMLALSLMAAIGSHLSTAERWSFGVLFAILGITLLVGAWKGRETWLDRLGPLP